MASSVQARVVAGIATAIRMEIDGKAFYLKASAESKNEAGRKLLGQLAAEEDEHRKTFEQIYESFRRDRSWPAVQVKPSAGMKTLFSPGESAAELNGHDLMDESSAVNTALMMESESYDFYESRINMASCDSESRFYQEIAAQERGHYMALLDYLEFIQSPTAYFTRTEHHSLDGG